MCPNIFPYFLETPQLNKYFSCVSCIAGLNGMSSSIWEHPSGQGSPGTPPALLPTMGQSMETVRVRQELDDANRLLKHWDHTWRHTAQVREVGVGVGLCVCVCAHVSVHT